MLKEDMEMTLLSSRTKFKAELMYGVSRSCCEALAMSLHKRHRRKLQEGTRQALVTGRSLNSLASSSPLKL